MGGKWYALLAAIFALLSLASLSGAGAAMIAGGSNFSAAITTAGTLTTWGGNGSGQLGNSTTTNVTTPTPIGTGTTWSAVAAGSNFTVAVSVGSLWAWGDNSYYQLGDGTTTGQTAPEQIGSGTTWSTVAAGSNFALAIASDGSLWAWGDNSSGQLGNGTTTPLTTPTHVAPGTTWSTVAAGSNFTVAIASNGTLWAWGDNTYGELGNGKTTGVTAPVQVGTGTTWTSIAAGSDFTVAVSNGNLWAWGDNSSSQLGNGTTTNASSPVQIGTGTTWSTVAAGSNFAMAIASDGSLWTWGDNSYGELGNGTTTGVITPSPIAAGTTWSAIAAGSDFALAIASNGSLWTWGDNSSSQLGDGTTTTATLPEQVVASGYSVLPTVTSTVPVNGATDVEIDSAMQVTFSEPMDPTSITTATFTLDRGVTGVVTYNALTNTATFTPTSNLDPYTLYTATVTTGVRDSAGNHMAANYTWTFTTETKKKGFCFIATAAYGSSLEPHVAALRAFRDTCLMTNRAGRSFVDFYYRCSPPLANLIARHPALRTITRCALTPLVYGVVHSFLFGLIPLLSLVWIYLEKRRRRRKIRRLSRHNEG
jgi:alpha-tubulin suppressor-like RCC1 family protein